MTLPHAHRSSALSGEHLAAVAAAAWIAHVSGGYALTALHCHRHFLEGQILGLSSARLALLLLSFLAAALVLAAGLHGILGWRKLRDDPHGDPNGRRSFTYLLAAALAALVLLYLLWTLVPMLGGDLCD